ncbi:hypothetical protein LKO27_01000 [Tessaracoccus sp. OS52]|uniref:hypothetical protein n=1 Tax=Tessaracoccus sp. OS52 TaxID=2886691 RepID=UPI001D10FCEF|nr:hypothetical protein [Tessaracoccus sp. OS52]MCC2592008.1 hypothetical protein [Tessaracoccus sp. OS52]
MASWTDGAAYAPTERPDGFASPEVDPLSVAEPQLARTAGPVPPPQGFAPSAPQPPLDQIRTDPPASRNPSEPFRTVAATMTATPESHAGERDPRLPFHTYTAGAGSQELPPPTGDPLPPPVGAPVALPVDFPPPVPGAQALPPGMPGPMFQTTRPPFDPKPLRTLLILAMVALALGVIVPGTAPWFILVSGLLGLRTKALTGSFGVTACWTGGALLLLTAVLPPESLNGLSGLLAFGFVFWAAYGLRKNPTPRR